MQPLPTLLLSLATFALGGGALVVAGRPVTPIATSVETQASRQILRTHSPQFPVGPGGILSAPFDEPYLAIHGLTELRMGQGELDPAKLPLLLASLRTRDGTVPGPQQVSRILTYCGPERTNPAEGPLNVIHGISILRQSGIGQEVHELYRFDEVDGLFLEDTDASRPLDGALTLDDVLLLHYGCVPPSPEGGPGKRSRIEVLFAPASAPFVDAWPGGETAVELRLALLSSPRFQTGMSLIAAHGEGLYSALGHGEPGAIVRCHALPMCGWMLPPNKCLIGFLSIRCATDLKKLDCPLAQLEATIHGGATAPGSNTPSLPLAQAWEFRDSFLAQSETGRRYIAWYYKLGALLEIDVADVPAYLELLQKASHAMDLLLDEQSTEVVITQELANSILAVLAIQRSRIHHVEILAILDQVEADVMWMTGLTREEIELLFL